jgi:hypothetical protein
MCKQLSLSLFCAIAVISYAQDSSQEISLRTKSIEQEEVWSTGGRFNYNLSQVSLTNWASGGQNSTSFNTRLSLYARYKKENISWDNSLNIAYGMTKDAKNKKWWKTDDKIDLTSKYGREVNEKWYYAGLLNFKTQINAGYNFPNDSILISNALAPAYITIAMGLDYKHKTILTAYLAPLTIKTTFVNNDELANAGAYGVDPATYNDLGQLIAAGSKTRTESGAYIRVGYEGLLTDNFEIKTKLELFSNYKDNPQNIDVNLEQEVMLKINKYFSVTAYAQLVYDDDVNVSQDTNNDGITDKNGPIVQYKEIIGIGLTYTF